LNQSDPLATPSQDFEHDQQPDLSDTDVNHQQSDANDLSIPQGHTQDDDLANQDYFDPGNIDEDEQREDAHAAQLSATRQALDQLEQLPPDSHGGDEEPGFPPATLSHIENIQSTLEFTKKICAATLDNDGLDANILDHLCNPSEKQTDISDPNICLLLNLFSAVTNASGETYNSCRAAILRRYPDSNVLSYYSVKKLVSDITGVVAVYDDMCINSCHGFTGPFSQLESCTLCGEVRYDAVQLASTGKKVPRQQFCTILLGPQLQALRRSHSGATNMRYLDRKLRDVAEMLDNLQTDNGADIVYDDILCGTEAQDLANRINITAHDTLVSSSLDGAQLYQNKKSDTWISIWIIHNFPPDSQYQKWHISPGTIISGPNKPKITNSYFFHIIFLPSNAKTMVLVFGCGMH